MNSVARRLQANFCKHLLLSALAGLPLLTGCAIGTPAGREVVPSASAYGDSIQGTMHGGQQPVTGAHIYLFEAGIATGTTTTTYATQPAYTAKPVSLLTSSSGTVANPAAVDSDGNYYVTTDSNGNWGITAGSYTCGAGDSSTPSIPRQTYFLAIGGDPGAGSNNPDIAMMAASGDCTGYTGTPSTTGLTSSTTININELTTVAAATALQQFANFATGNTATPVGFSTSTTNTAGLRRAILTANNMVNLTTGAVYTTTPTTGSAGTVPSKLLTDLANVIGGCVNSVPSTSSTYCATLSTETGSSSTTDTLTDALEIALNPSLGSPANVATMWSNIPPASAFGLQLAAAPNDWSLAITWTPTGLNTNRSIAIDASGNVWSTAYGGGSTNGNNTGSLVELDNAGNVLQSAYESLGYKGQSNTVIDQSGNVWATGSDTVVFVAGVEEAIKNLSASNVAFDPAGNGWANNGTTMSELTYTSGTSYSAYTSVTGVQGLTSERESAFDQKGYLWAPNDDSPGTVAIFTVSDGANGASTITPLNSTTPYNYKVNSGTATADNIDPLNVAFDANNYAYISVLGGYEQMSPANSSGGPTPLSTCTGATRGSCGISAASNTTTSVAIDGTGNVWLAAYASGSTATAPYTTTSNIEKFAGASASNAGTTLSGSGLKSDQQGIDKPYNLAIDGSGNIWVINLGGDHAHAVGQTDPGSISEFVGLASPVITPLSVALKNSKLATCP